MIPRYGATEVLCQVLRFTWGCRSRGVCVLNVRLRGDSRFAGMSLSARTHKSLTQPSIGTITPSVGCKSSCGNQVKSTVASNPSYGFGTATREIASKKFISNEHTNKEVVHWTPGPGAYTHVVATGKQPVSTMKQTEAWGFGTEKRFSIQERESRRTQAVPGPGAYFS